MFAFLEGKEYDNFINLKKVRNMYCRKSKDKISVWVHFIDGETDMYEISNENYNEIKKQLKEI